jgi:hypothetical protein
MMAQQWQDVHEAVAKWLKAKSHDAQLPQLWQNVFGELHDRWTKRKEIVSGQVGKEITIKISVASIEIAEKALKRIAEFSKEFGSYETDEVTIKLLGQKYKKDGDLSVLVRIRIVGKSENSRSKFEVDDPTQI